MEKVIIFVGNVFSERDFKRFGIKRLQDRGLRVEVWDFTAYLYPHHHGEEDPQVFSDFAGLRLIHKKKALKDAVATLKGGEIIFSLLPYVPKIVWGVYRRLESKNISLGTGVFGPLPVLNTASGKSIGGDYVEVIRRAIRDPVWLVGKLAQRIYTFLAIKYGSMRLPFIKVKGLDYIVLSGEKALEVNSYPLKTTTDRVWCHSLDYDLFLETGASLSVNRPGGDYAIFLDEFGPFHPDFDLLGMTPYYSPEEYYPSLMRFFDHIEAKMECEIVIAAHPRSNYEKYPDLFNGRKIIRGDTINLVRHARFVIGHQTTSLSFAVLYMKSVIILTKDTYSDTFRRYVEAMALALGKKPINLSQPLPQSYVDELVVNRVAYDKYKEDYIKRAGTPKKNTWDIVADYYISAKYTTAGADSSI